MLYYLFSLRTRKNPVNTIKYDLKHILRCKQVFTTNLKQCSWHVHFGPMDLLTQSQMQRLFCTGLFCGRLHFVNRLFSYAASILLGLHREFHLTEVDASSFRCITRSICAPGRSHCSASCIRTFPRSGARPFSSVLHEEDAPVHRPLRGIETGVLICIFIHDSHRRFSENRRWNKVKRIHHWYNHVESLLVRFLCCV